MNIDKPEEPNTTNNLKL